jgi:hypothetical protein
MIDTAGWTYLHKLDYINKHEVPTNMLYTPLVSPDGTRMCMLWDETSEYQKYQTNLTKELMDFFFQREVKYLMLCQQFDWAPRVFEVNLESRQIVIEWNTETLNHIVLSGRKLDELCPDWKPQIKNIIKDLRDEGYYKMALYPHCFFIDKNNRIKTFDFYGCAEIDNPYIERSKVEGIIGVDSGGRFDSATVNGNIDFSIFFKNTLLTHLANTWTDNPFPEIYNTLFKGTK